MRKLVPTTRAVNYVRQQAQQLMTSTVEIYRPGVPSFDTTTGLMTATEQRSIYIGPAHVWTAKGNMQEVAGELLNVTQTFVSIPWTAPVPRSDDIVHVTASNDTALTGRYFRIVDVPEGGIDPIVRQLSVTGTEPDAFSG